MISGTISLYYREYKTIGCDETIGRTNNNHCLTIGWVGTHNRGRQTQGLEHTRDNEGLTSDLMVRERGMGVLNT